MKKMKSRIISTLLIFSCVISLVSSQMAFAATPSSCVIKSYVSSPLNTTLSASTVIAKGGTVYLDIYLNNTTTTSDTSGVNNSTIKLQYDSDNFSIGNSNAGIIQGTEGTDFILGTGVPTGWEVIQFAKTGSGSASYLNITVGDPDYFNKVLKTTTEAQILRLVFKANATANINTYDFTYVKSESGVLKTYLGTYDGFMFTLDSSNHATTFSMAETNAQVIIAGQNPVTYDGNGATSGSVPTDVSSPYVQGAKVTVLGNTGNLAKTGHSFAGWNTAANGSGTSYAAGATFAMGTSAAILYAQWTSTSSGGTGGGGGFTSTKYTVSYDGNGNTSGTAPGLSSYEANVAVAVSVNVGNLSKRGYTFSGWNTKADGTGTSYAVGSKITLGSENIVLYAVWSPSISYNNEDWASGSQNNYIVAYYKESGKILPLSYLDEKTGYVYYRAKNPVGILAKYNFVPFSDINEDFWAGEYIWFMSSRAIINGMGDGTYQPENNVTRAQFVKILASMIDGLDLDAYASAGFADVKSGQWYEKYINWALACKIADGYGNGYFGPNDPLTREQMCCIIDRFITYLNYKLQENSNLTSYADEGSVDAWALKSVKRLQGSGLVNGKPNNQFDPLGKSTRAEAATIACRLLRAMQSNMENSGKIEWKS